MIPRASKDVFAERLDGYRERVEKRLRREFSSRPGTPDGLRAAMEYSVLGSGKRIRPLLVYASGELCGVADGGLDAIAAAVEIVHAYSLIHDDLPAMDDDDLRRGKPSTHRAFDEATAILAGDALQALAFELLCCDESLRAQPKTQMSVISWLARAIGPAGMVGGQALDLDAENREVTEEMLEDIHRRKTGELIRAAIMMPSELSQLPAASRRELDAFARDIGLVFQIRDDLLEIDQDTSTLGKSAGSDRANNKATYPSILGVDAARAKADHVYERAMSALDTFGAQSEGLRWISDFILTRSH